MKREVFLGIFFVIFVLGIEGVFGAETTCESSQVIAILSGESNAHGSTWDGNTYPNAICYSELFGEQYIGQNPHECTGYNTLFYLTASRNAHGIAKEEGSGNGRIAVCYGELSCSTKTECDSDEVGVVSLSSQTNAHLGEFGYSYSLKVCCKSGSSEDINGVVKDIYWANARSERIHTVNVNTTVYLDANTTFPDGSEVSIAVYEADTVLEGWGDDEIISPIEGFRGNVWNGKLHVPFTINDSFVRRSDSLSEGNFLEGYFTIQYQGNTNKSNELKILKRAGGLNTAPIAVISRPLNRGVYFTNEMIEFNQTSSDREGEISSEWDISDELTNEERAKTSFRRAYTKAGYKEIRLKVSDDEGLYDEDRIGILVIDEGTWVYPGISNPKQDEVIRGILVSYNGNESYAVNYTKNPSHEVKCIAGNCPLTTNGCISGVDTCPIPIVRTQTSGLFNNLMFSWGFGNNEPNGPTRLGLGKVNGSYAYNGYGTKQIELNLSSGSVSGYTTRTFSLVQQRGCSEDKNYFYDLFGNRFSTSDDGVCGGDDGLPGGGDDCCPKNRTSVGKCVGASGAHTGAFCEYVSCNTRYTENGSEYSIVYCRDYNKVGGNKKEQCEEDCADAWKSEMQKSEISQYRSRGYSISAQGCVWIKEGNGGTCGIQVVSGGTPGLDGESEYSQCVQSVSEEGACRLDGQREITVVFNRNILDNQGNVIGISQDDAENPVCPPGGKELVPCGLPSIELPYTYLPGLIFGFMIVIVISLLLRWNQKIR